MNNSPQFRSAFIALLGRPNSGKSTLMNSILEEQISIVTALPQTTRKNIRGIYTTESMQLIFVDTPGIHKGKHAFNEAMIKEASAVLNEGGIDLVCYIVDLSRDFGEEEQIVSQIIASSSLPKLIIFNKSDKCSSAEEKKREFHDKFQIFKDTPSITLSAISKDAKSIFISSIEPFINPGPQYFDEDSLTDASMRFISSEIIRKQIILNTREEVPHATFVEIESYRESEERHWIIATIHVETTGQRGIIVGKKGSLISRIKRSASREISELTGVPVSLTLHVKVSPGWRDNKRFISRQGMPFSL
ncbi:GTP-binding protein Era [Chitinispirillum alkaliphilum]|nr:GTP-binding protein Era [Chitinispirillum alkaliphilum]